MEAEDAPQGGASKRVGALCAVNSGCTIWRRLAQRFSTACIAKGATEVNLGLQAQTLRDWRTAT